MGRQNGPAYFPWPKGLESLVTVGEAIGDLMSAASWRGARRWTQQANHVAPTIVGGSDRHGGPDLGPTRAKREWRAMRVDPLGIADAPPSSDFPEDGCPRLTVRMAARLQGFPDSWTFQGRKTSAYRQVGNAFPPPVATALASALLQWIEIPVAGGELKQLSLLSRDTTLDWQLASSKTDRNALPNTSYHSG